MPKVKLRTCEIVTTVTKHNFAYQFISKEVMRKQRFKTTELKMLYFRIVKNIQTTSSKQQ